MLTRELRSFRENAPQGINGFENSLHAPPSKLPTTNQSYKGFCIVFLPGFIYKDACMHSHSKILYSYPCSAVLKHDSQNVCLLFFVRHSVFCEIAFMWMKAKSVRRKMNKRTKRRERGRGGRGGRGESGREILVLRWVFPLP